MSPPPTSNYLSTEASKFDYRSRLWQEKVYLLEHQMGRYISSRFSWLLAGYGRRGVLRSFVAYFTVIIVFALIYYFGTPGLDKHVWYVKLVDAFVTSVNAFHGRAAGSDITAFISDTDHIGGATGPFTLLLYFATGLEAIVGLIVEVALIASLTRLLVKE